MPQEFSISRLLSRVWEGASISLGCLLHSKKFSGSFYLLYDQNCSQQRSPVKSTPSLKHAQIYPSS